MVLAVIRLKLVVIVIFYFYGTFAFNLLSHVISTHHNRFGSHPYRSSAKFLRQRSILSLSDGQGDFSQQDAECLLDPGFMETLLTKRPYLSILAERAMQNLDDMQVDDRIKMKVQQKKMGEPAQSDSSARRKEKIIVLGTGWGSHSFLKTIDSTLYDVVVVSPRNYFLFTPMLAASAVGTVELKSICDPIRDVNPLADYLEASATSIDPVNKKVQCQSIKCEGTSCEMIDFTVDYDYLVVGVGAAVNTYGIKGVKENCLFLKQIDDASNIRRAIINCFERANVPGLTEEAMRNMLSFVIVGAGPTGVEFTSELRDWVELEGRRYYSKLLKYVRITLVEAGSCVLPVFDENLRNEALQRLTARETDLIREGLISSEITSVRLRVGVKEVGQQAVLLSSNESLPYGFCVWAAGNGPLPFVSNFINDFPPQLALRQQLGAARGCIAIDPWLKVVGASDIFAIGDCSAMQRGLLPPTAQVASQQGAYLGRLFSKGFTMSQPDNLPPIKRAVAKSSSDVSSSDSSDGSMYLSEKVNLGNLGVDTAPAAPSPVSAKELAAVPFQFLNLGVLAYIGASQALAQVSVDDQVVLGSGNLGFLLWRGVYWFKQVSWRNRVLVGIDWVKAKFFGRDIGAF